jgi:hypothetical protein
MFKGESSELRVAKKVASAEVISDSGAWKGGERLEIIEGVRSMI